MAADGKANRIRESQVEHDGLSWQRCHKGEGGGPEAASSTW